MHTATEWIQLFFFVKYGSRRGCLSIGGSICGDACFSRVIFVCRAGAMLENEGHKSGVWIRVSWVRTRSSNPPYVFFQNRVSQNTREREKRSDDIRFAGIWCVVFCSGFSSRLCRYENENDKHNFSASLLSSGQQVFAVVLARCFCGFPPIGKHCIKGFRLSSL